MVTKYIKKKRPLLELFIIEIVSLTLLHVHAYQSEAVSVVYFRPRNKSQTLLQARLHIRLEKKRGEGGGCITRLETCNHCNFVPFV